MPEERRDPDVYELFRFLVQEEAWREKARCREVDAPLDWFFPPRGASHKAAKAICARCPVAVECDEYARRTRSSYGIWGGKIRKRGRVHDLD